MTDERLSGDARTYLIGDVAALTGVTDHTLRAWEALGLLAPCRSARGVRQYTEDDLARVRLIIHTLRKPGHSRRVVANLLKSGDLCPDAADYAPGAALSPRRRASAASASADPPDDAARARDLTHLLKSLARVSAAVASGRPLREVLDVLCKETCAALGVPDAVLWLMEAESPARPPRGEQWLTIAAGAGPHAEAALRAPTVRASSLERARMPAALALRTHRPEVVKLREASPEAHPEIAALLPAAALLVAPLFSQQGQALGLLVLREAFNANRFGEEDREYARLFASQAALAIESASLQEALRAARDEAELERSRWRAAVDDLPELVCLCDAEGRFTYASPAHQNLIKRPPDPTLSPEEWPAHYGHYVPETGEPFPARELVFPRVLRERAPVKDVEILHRGTDGEEHLIVWSGAPMHTPDGTLLGVVAVGPDITEQRRLERELAARARELDAVLEAMPDGVVRFDERNQVTLLNQKMRALFAVDTQRKTHVASLERRAVRFDLRDEHGHALPPERLPSARLLRGEPLGPDAMMDMRIKMPDGSVNQFNVNGATFRDGADRITGALMILRDVTYRSRQSERMACLMAVTRAAAGAPDPVGVEARAARLLTALKEHGGLPLLTAGIYLVDHASETIYLAGHVAGEGASDEGDPLMRQIALSPRHPAWGAFAREATYSYGSRRPPDWLGVWVRDAWRAERLRGWATAPVRARGEVLGVLVMALTGPHLWDDEERAWFAACADAMAMGLENDRLFAAERHQHELLHAVIESVEDGITLVSADGRMPVRNSAARALTGRADLAGSLANAAEVYGIRDANGDPLPFEATPVARALRGERVRGSQLRMRDGQGRDRVMSSDSTPMRDPHDAVIGAVTTFRDITAQTRRIELIRRIGRRLGATLDPEIEMRTLVDVLVESEIVRAAGVYALLPDERTLTFKVARIGPQAAAILELGTVPPQEVPLVARAIEERQPAIIRTDDPTAALPARIALLMSVEPEIVAVGMLPLLVEDRVLGVVATGLTDAREFNPRALEILMDVTTHAALLIDRATRHQRLLAEARHVAAHADTLERVPHPSKRARQR